MDVTGRRRLLNPGPVTLTPRVREALARPDLCHREAEFSVLQTEVRDRLRTVYVETESDYEAVLLTGSGTAAVEAMIGSLVPYQGKALVVANGVYGERIAAILAVQQKAFETVTSAWTEAINIDDVCAKLQHRAAFSHVIVVHHETTTGRLNDLAALGAVCRARNIPLLVDAVSSFGGERIDFSAWNVEACAATANKCLHGVPGISFVLVRSEVFASHRESGSRSLYLDLFRNREKQSAGYPLFTPAVQALYALHEALAELEDLGGWERRHQHYATLSRGLRTGLNRVGLELLLSDPRSYSAMLTSFVLPRGVSFQQLFCGLKNDGFVIYPGQAAFEDAIFRIAVMGDLGLADIEELVAAVDSIVRKTAV